MNALTDASQQVEDKLFATLDTRTARWDLGNRQVALLSDTVGFVRDLPHRLVASFRATLEETLHARLLLHVVDVSAPDALWQVESVQSVLADLGCADAPTIALLNKVDVAQNEALIAVLENRLPRSICVSAKTGYGLDHLVERVACEMRRRATHITVRTAVGNGRLIAEIDRLAEVVDRRYLGNVTEMVLNIDHTQLEQLLGRYPDLKVVPRAESTPPDAALDLTQPCRPDPNQ